VFFGGCAARKHPFLDTGFKGNLMLGQAAFKARKAHFGYHNKDRTWRK
jgi:hypothetical protein